MICVPPTPTAVIVDDDTVWLRSTVYVPVPPVPVPKPIIRVLAKTPVPDNVWPLIRPPLVTPVTVSVVSLIDPVTTALWPSPSAVSVSNCHKFAGSCTSSSGVRSVMTLVLYVLSM